MNVSMRGNSVYAQNHAKAGSIGGISLPDFEADYVYSKKQSKVSEQEYKKKIVEQAYKDYANGKKGVELSTNEAIAMDKAYTTFEAYA